MRAIRPFRLSVNGLSLQGYEWPGAGPVTLLAHATGFHSRCWDQIVERLPGFHVYAIDFRGHGLSDKPDPPYPWRPFGEDLAIVAGELGLEGALAAGHSKGGHALVLAASIVPRAFSSLLLIDPVISPERQYGGLPAGEHFAARRRNAWASPAEMYERFHARPPFDRWDPAVLRDYCEYGLVPDPAREGYVLACPPAVEASVYAGGRAAEANIYDVIPRVEMPVRILRARPRPEDDVSDMGGSPTAPDLAMRLPNGEDVVLPHLSHFIPMEAPELVAAHLRELAGQGGLTPPKD